MITFLRTYIQFDISVRGDTDISVRGDTNRGDGDTNQGDGRWLMFTFLQTYIQFDISVRGDTNRGDGFRFMGIPTKAMEDG